MRRMAPLDREVYQVMAEAYAVNDHMYQLILEHLDPSAWRAQPPGKKGRTIAAIVSHVHNIRRKWLRLSAPLVKLPPPLHRARCTPKQAQAALAESAARCCEMLSSLAKPRSRINKFHRDGWAKPWPAGAAMFAYMITHDAHHRGQICWLARELGYPLPKKVGYTVWDWEKLWKDCGFTHPR